MSNNFEYKSINNEYIFLKQISAFLEKNDFPV